MWHLKVFERGCIFVVSLGYSLTIRAMTGDTDGKYRCQATDVDGMLVTSNESTLTVRGR